ncbi:DUF1801 domain-containing protein [Labrenzia sp. 011]|nr:DUF1801 domain-containing protein [Labrenzia sp. 011]
MLDLRRLIHDTARENDGIGVLEETLKWGQPSFLTVRPKTGTTIRIDRDTSPRGDYSLFVSCRSSLVSQWRGLFPHLTFGGDRSVHFRLEDPMPVNELRQMITMALTYHSGKRKPVGQARLPE